MTKLNSVPGLLVVLGLPLALTCSGCSTTLAQSNGACAVDSTLDCGVSSDGGVTEAGLTGYACTGLARPDQDARYVESVPQGTVCADRGTTADGRHSYCCSPSALPTTCAYNPVATCSDPDTFGYECRGSSRPEAFNPALICGNGVVQGDYLDYCCSGEAQAPGCTELKGAFCPKQLTGFSCSGGELPKAEQFGTSESRADYYRPLCPTPTQAPNPNQKNYCCYMPALIPEGGSCVQDTAVPGCAAGRFGFACYGPESPDQDYPPMHCPEKGVSGKSAEGYSATLYCCDFQATSPTL